MFNIEPTMQERTLSLALTGDVLMPDVIHFNDIMRGHSKTPNITQMVLNLAGVGKMDMAALGALVSLNTSMQRYGRRLVLMQVPPHVEALLEQAEIEGFFALCESEEELRGFFIQPLRRNS